MKKFLFLLFSACFFLGATAFAQDVEVPPMDFLNQILETIQDFGGLSWVAKIAAILAIIISSMKVSFLKTYWDKLGEAKVWLAPILSVAFGIISLGVNDETAITWAGVFAYMTAGAGAVFLHEILDSIKAMPGIGSMWVSIIDFIKIVLRAPAK